MTDPRIEAAARALCIARRHDPDELIWITTEPGVQEPYGSRWTFCYHEAEQALAAADAAAWRPIADCETMKPVLVLQGRTQLVAQKIMDAELSDDPVWRVVEGETNEDSGAYLVYLDPAPTHWRPLHATPEGEMQG